MGAQQNAAIVTPSYAGDFERCRLLCESMDRYVTGYTRHYLLVASHDVELFRALETDRRVVVDERDLLPSWLHAVRDPTSLFRRHVWLSTRLAPLRGWHVQQLRRIAFAEKATEDALVYCDSDVVFLKPFDCGDFWRDGQMRLYRKSGGMHSLMDMGHRDWLANAGRALDLPAGQTSDHDYITTLIAWRRETVLDMLRRIETVHGRPWINVVASDRRFSECILYGRYVDEVLNGEGHFHDDRALCHIYWLGPELDETGIERFIAGMEPYQVAIGIQSFTETSLEPLRRVIG
ncbi:MAG: DUF6492 family protein [Nitratireductor sp.]|uniref:DUF6492 family protein n=1 Tax=Nitratireductor sp. TaxID=1872084 RepID=UPI00260674EF|nr:DUF6492 family protein [Nitratireductor sp.]MCV0352133.1 DUF6492 family protein [Nitratireductor sp.]